MNYSQLRAMELCYSFAKVLRPEKPDWAEVAVQCGGFICDNWELAPTIVKDGFNPCQELSSFLIAPEIDYTSGLPR